MNTFPNPAAWRDACANDASLGAWSGAWSVCFGIASGTGTVVFSLVDGKVRRVGGDPAFTLAAPHAL